MNASVLIWESLSRGESTFVIGGRLGQQMSEGKLYMTLPASGGQRPTKATDWFEGIPQVMSPDATVCLVLLKLRK
jgi:hypothetical protein